MKKQQISVVALVLGLALAFGNASASKSNEVSSVYARLDNGQWILVTPQTEEEFRCESDDDICKAEFTSDPNQPGATMLQVIEDDGVYIPL